MIYIGRNIPLETLMLRKEASRKYIALLEMVAELRV